MSMRIIYGRSGTGKTSYIFDELSKNINNGRKKYIITPEQFSFSAEKELLDNIKKNQALFYYFFTLSISKNPANAGLVDAPRTGLEPATR